MNLFDETPPPDDPNAPSGQNPAPPDATSSEVQPPPEALLAIAESPAEPALPAVRRPVPEDLQVTWSWPHFIIFLVFAFISLIVIQTALAAHYAPSNHLSTKDLEEYLLSNPKFAIGSMVV